VEPEKAPAVEAIAQKWELPCVEIGEVVEEPVLTYIWRGEVVAQLDPRLLAAGEGAPTYDWPRREPAYRLLQAAFQPEKVPDLHPTQLKEVLKALVAHPNLASRAWIYTQYDRMVGAGTMGSAGEIGYAAALVRLPGQARALAMSLDGNPFWVEADPRVGAALLVSEAARNVACTGARPLGITNGLNFGSPQDPEVYYTFVETIEGIREACSFFGLPVTGGNVSFYNQDERGPILPTPMIGVVGLLERPLERAVPLGWPQKGIPLPLLLIGSAEALYAPTLGASHYLRDWVGIRHSPAPRLEGG
jgi:phosphoribosylformylglycinamidine (FGAM) synthase-like enzyme